MTKIVTMPHTMPRIDLVIYKRIWPPLPALSAIPSIILRIIPIVAETTLHKNIKLILVDIGETPEEVRQYTQKNKISFDVFLDVQSSLAESYGIIGVPTFVFVSADGKIKAVEHSLPKDYEKILSKK